MDTQEIGFRYLLPHYRQELAGSSVEAYVRLLHHLSPYQKRPLQVDDLVQLADRSVFLLTARDSGHGEVINVHRLVGIVRLARKPPLGSLRRGELHDTVVTPGRRREHIGEKLTREAIKRAQGLGYGCLELAVKPAREEAIALFEKLGFKLIQAADPRDEGSHNLYRLMLR